MKMNSISIRQNNPTDTTPMFNIWEDAVQATHHFLTTDDISNIGIQVKEYLSTASFMVATNSNTILGFMGITDNKIDSLFIDPKYFGMGIGKCFISYAFSLHNELYVDVNEDNTQAKGFYEKMGFKIINRSELDDEGRPFPILKMKANKESK